MAKHDQRILKFLNQNADRAPTITDMMTRLNISISDISDSLGSLVAQGQIAKRTNNQGIECWFPVGAAQPSSIQNAPTQQMPNHMHQQQPQPQLSAAELVGEIRSSSESRPMVDARQLDSRYMGGMTERPMPLPDAQPPSPKPAPVHVQHIPMAERSVTQTQSFQAMSPGYSPPDLAGVGSPTGGQAPNFNFSQPAAKGVGFLTFAVGLVVAVGFSTFLAGRLASNEIHQVQKSFVDQKALTDANAAFLEFQGKTKSHITALEEEIKKLNDQLAISKAADSLKVAAVAPPGKGVPAKGAIAKAEEAPAKTKAGKKAQLAKSSKTAALLAKTTVPHMKRKKMPAHGPARSESQDSAPSEESSASASDASPSVPQAPGLDNQDLPPPSAE